MTQTPTLSRMPVQTLSMPTQQDQPIYEISEADRARQKKIADAWKAYNGELDPPLRKMPDGTDPNVRSNRLAPIVDGGVNFLFGKELEISIEEGAPDAAQTLLDTTWGRKERRIPLLQKLAMSGAIAGQAFLRIVPAENGSFRLVVVDPSIVFVKTAPQDCETALLYCIEYSTDDKRDGKPVRFSYREEITRIDPQTPDNADAEAIEAMSMDIQGVRWQVQHWSRVGERGPWTPAGDPIAWNYPFPPLFSCQNLPNPHEYWGKPDITPDLIGLNQSLNMVLSCIQQDEILLGHPILYATGTDMATINREPGKIIGLGLIESKIVAVNIVTDVPNALLFARDLRSDIDEQSGVPGVATGRVEVMPRGAMSGVAIKLFFMSLLKKTGNKQCLYGKLIIDVCKALFVLSGMSGDIEITLAWGNPLPEDDLQSIQASVLLKQVGISNTTIQRNLGFDPDEEMALSQSEDAQSLQNYSKGQGLPPVPPGQAQPQQQAQAPAESPFIGNQGGQQP